MLVLATALVLGVGGARGGLTARIADPGDTAQTGSLVTAAASGGSTECDLSTAAYSPITASSNAATCSGTLAASGTLPSSGSAALTTTLSEKGSLPSSAGLSAGACGPVQLANSATSSNPMLVRGATSFAQAGPSSLSGSAGLGLAGTSGYAADVNGVAGPSTTSFTEAIWFKTTAGGTLMGFIDTPSTYSPNEWDKMLWVDSAGHVVFAVYPNATEVELKSSGTYLDGQWHLAVASLSTSAGLSLSVDGGTPVTASGTTSAQAYTGYWHIGWDDITATWPDPPSDDYFTGTLADAAVFPSALTSAQISTLYGKTTQAGWAAQVSADGAGDAWSLGDDGTSAYTGSVPGVSPAACSFVDATVGVAGASTSCAAPSSGSACPAPASTATLATLASATTPFAAGPTRTQSLAVTITLARDSTRTVSAYPYANGLDLTSSLALAAAAGSFTARLTWPSEAITL